MKGKIKELAFVVVWIAVFSYVFNFIWESFHSVFLYENHNFPAIQYVPVVNYVAVIDTFLILGLYVFVSIAWKGMIWLRGMDKKKALAILLSGLIVSAVIEYRALFVLYRWSYTASMTILFGIGLSPLVQLSVTGILEMWLTRRLLYQKGRCNP